MLLRLLAVAALGLVCLSQGSRAADNAVAVPATPALAATNRAEEVNAQEMLRAYLQLQEQLHATQIAVEETRKASDQIAAQNAEVLSGRLQAIEQSLATQRARELEAMQSSNRVMLIVAGTFAALGFLAMLLMAYFQWRTVSRLAEITAALPAVRALPAPAPLAALGPGDSPVVTVSSVEPLNGRLLGAIDRLEKRIQDLESQPHASREPGAHLENGEARPNGDEGSVALLLGKGQSLLNLDQAEESLVCFEAVLKAAPDHAEALVKKGAALERLRRTEEAIACYDRAITIDRNLTIAYLYKGGLFNRLERYGEALECYEQALRTQEQRATAE
jgi:tetratricopeptide (TPR) repeat protein